MQDDVGLILLGYDLTVGDRVEVFDSGLLGRVEQDAQALVADVVDHPLGDQEVGQFGQAPGRERQVVLGRFRLRDLLDLAPLGAV